MNIVQPNYPPPSTEPAYRDLSVVTLFIIHHEAGPRDETALQVDAQHRSQGWAMIGYTWVIGEDGTVSQGRPMNMVPAAAQGSNTISVDVSLTGNFEPSDPGYTGPPTPAQIQALKDLCVYAHQKIPTINQTLGHRDVNQTACPGDDLYKLLPEIRDYVHAELAK